MTDIDLVNKPVSTKNYSIYDIDKLPKVVLGIKVKNKFDESRLTIKSKYRPKLILHFTMDPVFLYGIEIAPKPSLKSLLSALNTTKFLLNGDGMMDVTRYMTMLAEFQLSCDTCYRYLSDGVFPVDIVHLPNMTNKNLTTEIQSGFDSMVKKSTDPWYLNLKNFNIFILGKSTGYTKDYRINTYG